MKASNIFIVSRHLFYNFFSILSEPKTFGSDFKGSCIPINHHPKMSVFLEPIIEIPT